MRNKDYRQTLLEDPAYLIIALTNEYFVSGDCVSLHLCLNVCVHVVLSSHGESRRVRDQGAAELQPLSNAELQARRRYSSRPLSLRRRRSPGQRQCHVYRRLRYGITLNKHIYWIKNNTWEKFDDKSLKMLSSLTR